MNPMRYRALKGAVKGRLVVIVKEVIENTRKEVESHWRCRFLPPVLAVRENICTPFIERNEEQRTDV